ncbi:Ankyrin repeat protein [Tenacibaculum sp. 190130A14a]|uniref:Ankyrin repeat protein n=1 Tax=Tenacibaculum polynesiense TaxID=3137857 RepID=A0ABM9PA04_9FLAO
MKKIFLAMFAIVLATGTMTATTSSETNHKTSYEFLEPSTFCKLIRSGNFEAVKAMIENGTNINRKSTGLTPLMFAARYNRVDILKLLIEKGAKLKVKSDNGYTALDYAKMSKAHEAYTIIKEALNKK